MITQSQLFTLYKINSTISTIYHAKCKPFTNIKNSYGKIFVTGRFGTFLGNFVNSVNWGKTTKRLKVYVKYIYNM